MEKRAYVSEYNNCLLDKGLYLIRLYITLLKFEEWVYTLKVENKYLHIIQADSTLKRVKVGSDKSSASVESTFAKQSK